MKRLAIVIMLILLPIGALAEESKRASVEELLVLTRADAIIDSIYSQMDQMMLGIAQQLGMQPSEQELFEKYTAKMTAVMKEEMSWEKMKGPIIDIYLKHYSEKEVQDMIAFYRSATGRSMVEKMPDVMKDSMFISQQMVQNFMPKMQEISLELRDEVAAARQQQ